MQQYHQALDDYCASVGCKKPTPDKPKPPPATLDIKNSKSHGGTGGGPFNFSFPSTTLNAVKIVARSGANLDNIQIELGDGVKNVYLTAVGGGGGGHG